MKDIRIKLLMVLRQKNSSQDYCKNLGYTYLDTGAMYRSATYLALQNGLTEENVPEILSNYLNIRFHSEKQEMVVSKFM